MQYNLITDLQGQQPDIQDRGLHYGDGLFETMLLYSGKIDLWDFHYLRLSRSAIRLGIICPDRSWFEYQLTPFVQLQQNQIIKIMLTRGSGGRGLMFPDTSAPNIYILHYPYSKDIDNHNVIADISSITLSKNKNLAGLKHLNRLDYVLATKALKQHFQYNEAILCDSDGFIIEGIVHNLFFVIKNEVCTPDLSECGVDGILRQFVLENLKLRNQTVNIGHFSKQDLFSASECFLCNSVQGIRPVIRIQETEYAIGPVTQHLQQEFHGYTGH